MRCRPSPNHLIVTATNHCRNVLDLHTLQNVVEVKESFFILKLINIVHLFLASTPTLLPERNSKMIDMSMYKKRA